MRRPQAPALQCGSIDDQRQKIPATYLASKLNHALIELCEPGGIHMLREHHFGELMDEAKEQAVRNVESRESAKKDEEVAIGFSGLHHQHDS